MAEIHDPEHQRMEECGPESPWRRWGTYLSERQWGTVREDYSPDGSAWDYFPHDHARSRAYRWGEDGLLGWCDDKGLLNFAIGLWNGKDPILKERLFGLTNSEGNHGEDVKELYYFLAGLPTATYMKARYDYPIAAYPYDDLVDENKRRTKTEPEYELLDTGAMDGGAFEVVVEYAKFDPLTTAIRITVTNASDKEAELSLLGQLWFRNRWTWGPSHKPNIALTPLGSLHATHEDLGNYYLIGDHEAKPLFTENETNFERLFGSENHSPHVKDAFHRYVVNGEEDAVNPAMQGTKAALLYQMKLAPRLTRTFYLLLTPDERRALVCGEIEQLFEQRIAEAHAFYENLANGMPSEVHNVMRQAFAGLLWSKQFYRYNVENWLDGDPLPPLPPDERRNGRNSRWKNVDMSEVMSMPDTWEYPWFAAWDLAFHTVSFALVDPEFAKSQLLLLTREWTMHPNAQIPAYEWAFGDVNPPVHAWAAWRVYTIERRLRGKGDRLFLERIFHKLMLNFTWWVNRKDYQGNNVFEGGFLGLDNIGIFDRDMTLTGGLTLEQSDGTSWMAFFSLSMLTISLELAEEDPAYEDIAIKFFEHFIYIARAMTQIGEENLSLWDEDDGFFYDVLHNESGYRQYLKVRTAVGIIPLFAVTTLDHDQLMRFPEFYKRMKWFLEHKPDLIANVASLVKAGMEQRRLLSIVNKDQLSRILERLLDPAEFLSDFGIRALSKAHSTPVTYTIDGTPYTIDYEPGESTTGSFGGNSNWRGPIWFPINYLLIEALQNFDYYYGNEVSVELPKGSGEYVQLNVVAAELESRLVKIFLPDANGDRPVHNGHAYYRKGAPGQDLLLFYEYFHGDSGRGVGASHQTGWTALIAKIINQRFVTAYSDLG
jgi:hypothetical protein